MTMDTAHGTPHGAPIDYDWLRLLRRARRPQRRTGFARLLHALGLLAVVGGGGASAATPDAAAAPDSVIELRQYTLHAGQRDTLIDLFEQHFIESQEQTGLRVIGQFHDLDKPDRFVWLRSFRDMPARKAALESFYGGPVWKARREAANATMIDSDNVLLLRPAYAQSGFDLAGLQRPALDAAAGSAGLVVATIYYLHEPATPALLKLLRTRLEPQLRADGVRVLASFVTEAAANTFPALPVRLDEPVLVVFSAFDDEQAFARDAAARAASAAWREIDKRLQPYLKQPAEVLRLAATRRSLLRGN
jgi:quinol monooxygenase YgiN